MGRRSDPERIFEAWRVATRNRLTDSGMSVETAERWCDAWVLEATGGGQPKDGAYWQVGWDWIVVIERPNGRAGRFRSVSRPSGVAEREEPTNRQSGPRPGFRP